MTEVRILSGVALRSRLHDIASAITVEQDIINHCRANYYGFMDRDRHDLLQGVEANALARLAVLEEIAEMAARE